MLAAYLTPLCYFFVPAVGEEDWEDKLDSNFASWDLLYRAMLSRFRVIEGLQVTDGGGLTADFAAGSVDFAGTEYSITADSVALTAAEAGGFKTNWVYVDATGTVVADVAQPTGTFIPLAVVHTDESSIDYIGDFRPMSESRVPGPNLFINPGYRINQNVYTKGTIVGTANKYLLDGWLSDVTTGKITDNGDGTHTVTDIIQILDAPELDGYLVTISADVTDANTLTVSAGGADSRSSIGALTQVGTLSADTVSLTFKLDVGTKTYPAIKITGAASFKNLKLELGPVRTPLVPIPKAAELQQCQRYYFKTYAQSVAPGTVTNIGALRTNNRGTAASSWSSSISGTFPVTMRTIPTLMIYSTGTGTVGKLYDSVATADVNATAYDHSDSAFWTTNSGQASANCYLSCHVVANARI